MVSHARKDPTDFFVNDILLPSQMRDARINRYARQPEKQLIFAVFEDAVHCLVAYQSARQPSLRTLYLNAREWFTATDEEDLRWPFSFVNVCTMLGYEDDIVLRGLKQYLHVPTTEGAAAVLPLGTRTVKTKTAVFRAQRILAAAQQNNPEPLPDVTAPVNEHVTPGQESA